jgi:uncharacterized membrane protein
MSKQVQDEISLTDVNQFFNNQFKRINGSIFSLFQFFFKHKLPIISLFILGIVLGFFSDKNRNYKQEIIVLPNFNSVDYLYEKVNVFNSKIKEKDSLVFQKYGLKDFKKISKVEIVPIIDIYKLGQSSGSNLEMIKLMTEDISMDEIIEGSINKKAYLYHIITIKTKKKIKAEEVIQPFMNYLNDSDYFKELQKIAVENTEFRIRENDSTLIQLNGILNNFSDLNQKGEKSTSLIYYNENTQLNDLFYTKDKLTIDRGVLQANLVNFKKIITDLGFIENKMIKNPIPDKILFPIILVFLYMGIIFTIGFWKKLKISTLKK